jgi:hypothetical protein
MEVVDMYCCIASVRVIMMHEVLTCHVWRFGGQLEFDPAIGNKARFRRMEGAGACVMGVNVELYMYGLCRGTLGMVDGRLIPVVEED